MGRWTLACPAHPACVGYCIVPGDANLDLEINLADLMRVIKYSFKCGPAPLPLFQSGNFNCDAAVNSTVIIQSVNYLVKGRPPPCDVCAAR